MMVLALSGCSGAQIINAVTTDSGYAFKKDIRYSGNLSLDVYQPAGADHAPVVVFFYGGSWEDSKTLPKSSYKFVGQALAQQGYVTVIADYRLYPLVKYPDFLADCALAVRWAHEHAGEYGGDPGKLVLMGHSAGAYNAAMLALRPELLRAAGADVRWIRGMVGLAGPYDFLPITDPDLKIIFGPEDQWPLTQPIHYVSAGAPPMLLIAGDGDDVVWVKNTLNLAHALTAQGVEADTLIYPGMGHVRVLAQMSGWIPGHSAMMERIRRFVAKVTG